MFLFEVFVHVGGNTANLCWQVIGWLICITITIWPPSVIVLEVIVVVVVIVVRITIVVVSVVCVVAIPRSIP